VNVRRALTLIELVVGIAIAVILVVVLSRLTLGSLRVSTKGTTRLTGLQSAMVLLARVEKDLALARRLPDPADIDQTPFFLEISENPFAPTGQRVDSRADPGGDGFLRHAAGEPEHRFAPGHHVAWRLTRVVVPPADRIGCFLTIRLTAPPPGREETVLSRFVYPGGLPENRAKDSHWRW
jgi:hypothetical protein